MKPLTSVLALSAALAFAAPVDRPAYRPEEGLELRRSFEESIEIELDELSIAVDGMDMSEALGSFEFGVTTELTIVVEDEILAMGAGRPEKLRRTFDTLSSISTFSFSSDFESGEEDGLASSELEGRTVLFEWDGEEEEYAVSFDEDEEGDRSLLEGLEEDMDLRVLLPDEEVEVDDQWEIEPELLASIISPGGNLSLLPEGVDEEDLAFFEELLGENLDNVLDEALDGTVVCTFRGLREEEGAQLGLIEVVVEIDSSTDLADMLMEIIERIVEEEGGEIEDFFIDTADFGMQFEGEGRLLWNMEAGHFHSFEGSGDLTISVDLVAGAEGQTAELFVEASGGLEIGVTAE